jgi:hypothetical protein
MFIFKNKTYRWSSGQQTRYLQTDSGSCAQLVYTGIQTKNTFSVAVMQIALDSSEIQLIFYDWFCSRFFIKIVVKYW